MSRSRGDVSANDIALGVRGSHVECPVARAMFRATNGETWLVSKDAAVRWQYEESAELPPVARGFVDAFDAGSPVEPFRFDAQVVHT